MDNCKVYLKEDFNIESGGLDHENETLDELLESIDKFHGRILSDDEVNKYLNLCRILPIATDDLSF